MKPRYDTQGHRYGSNRNNRRGSGATTRSYRSEQFLDETGSDTGGNHYDGVHTSGSSTQNRQRWELNSSASNPASRSTSSHYDLEHMDVDNNYDDRGSRQDSLGDPMGSNKPGRNHGVTPLNHLQADDHSINLENSGTAASAQRRDDHQTSAFPSKQNYMPPFTTDDNQNGPAPGAYQVEGRAIGALPAWVRTLRQSMRRLSSTFTLNVAPDAQYEDVTNDQGNHPIEVQQVEHEQPPPIQETPSLASTPKKKTYFTIGLFIIFILLGVGVGIGLVISKLIAKSDGTSPVNGTTGSNNGLTPTNAPTPCPGDYDALSPAHKLCICTGSLDDLEVDFATLFQKYKELISHPSLQSTFESLGLDFETNPPPCYPNNVALFWLAQDIIDNNSVEESWRQRLLLATLFISWTGAEPFKWKQNAGWLTATSECLWFGVVCDDQTSRVTDIKLSFNQLSKSGGLPPALFELSTLKSIDLSFNDMNIGPISRNITKLQSLTSLNLRSNKVNGALPFDYFPPTIGTLKFENANIMSSIPVTIAKLTNLEILEMTRGQITGSIPSEIGYLTNLRELLIGRNDDLEGSIPYEIGDLNMLSVLDMRGDLNVETDLLSRIGRLSNLVSLDLAGIIGKGTIPSEIGRLTRLTRLDLTGRFQMTRDVFDSRKGFSGSLPSEVGNLFNLEILRLGGNEISGQIPSIFGQLSSLKQCDLGLNTLTGTIPSEIALLSSLETLRLRGSTDVGQEKNRLSGTFPSILGNLDSLTCLDASGTLLTGSVPETICFNKSNTTVIVNLRCVGIASSCTCCFCEAEDECKSSFY